MITADCVGRLEASLQLCQLISTPSGLLAWVTQHTLITLCMCLWVS